MHAGKTDALIAKFSSEGELLYASYFGGEDEEDPGHLVIENDKIYIVGSTKSQTNIATPGSYQENLNAFDSPTWKSGYIAQFNTEGELQWSTYFQGNRSAFFYEIATGLDDDVFIWGTTKSSDLGTPGVFKEDIPPPYISSSGSTKYPNYPFLARFDTDGNLIWSTYYGPDITSSQNDPHLSVAFSGIGVDFNNHVYISGNTQYEPNYFGTNGTHQPEYGGGFTDAFVAKFSDSGQLWGTYFGGDLNEMEPHLTVARKNQIFLTGITTSTSNIATPDSWQDAHIGTSTSNNSFIAEIDFDGQVSWSSYVSTSHSHPHVDTDFDQNIYLYNLTIEHAALITEGSYQETYGGGDFDASLIKLEPFGNQVAWGSYYGGAEREDLFWRSDMLIDDNKNIYLIGGTKSDDMASSNAFQETKTSSGSVSFITKFVPCPDIDAPTGDSIQYFNEGETLEDLNVDFMKWSGSEISIVWYADAEGNQPISSETELEEGQTYYVSQKIQGCKESELLAITVYLNLSISSAIFKNVQLYPNPNSGNFRITGLTDQLDEITIFDLRGRQVFNEKFIGQQNEYQMDLKGKLTTGLFFVKMKSGKDIGIFKMIVK